MAKELMYLGLTKESDDVALGKQILKYSRNRYDKAAKDVDAEIIKRDRYWKDQT